MRSRRLIQSPQPRRRLQDPQGFPPALTSHQFPPVHSIFIAAEGRRKHISSQRSSHGIAASQCAGMGDCRSGSRVVLAGRLPEPRLTPREPTEWLQRGIRQLRARSGPEHAQQKAAHSTSLHSITTVEQYKEQSERGVQRGQAVAEHFAETAEQGKEIEHRLHRPDTDSDL
jgi:hypothetical protein